MNAFARWTLPFAAALLAAAGSAAAGTISAELAQEMARHAPGDRVAVIVEFTDRVNPLPFQVKDRRKRSTALMRALKEKSALSLPRLEALLTSSGAGPRTPLWINNAVAVTVPVRAIPALARHAAVDRVGLDAVVPLASRTPVPTTPVPAWNLDAIHARTVWSLGAGGAGVVVATMDTGVDGAHPDLQARWRGGANSWFDPNGQHATPYDASGHGTQAMGLIVGGNAGGTPIGVAPQAQWIAAKIFNDAGQATLSNIHRAFQWLLDPDGNPATVDAPDVVNASWGLSGGTIGACNMEFSNDIQVLSAAGIVVVFAAGNDGPAPASASSPAANPGAFSVGAVDSALAVAAQSSRGPSGCDGAIFPSVAAPGQDVVSSDLSFGGLPLYAMVSGTSFAAPHASGTVALLAGAFPAASVAQLRNAVADSATDMGAAGIDNNSGAGLIDALAAYQMVANGNGGAHTPVITSLPATDALENQQYRYQVTATDADGGTLRFTLGLGPAGMAIDAATGLLTWTPSHAQAGANSVAVSVTDPTGRAATQAFSVLVATAPPPPPVAGNDSFSAPAYRAGPYAPRTLAVLANDSAPGGLLVPASVSLASSPSRGGKVTVNADGTLSYTPPLRFIGVETFGYKVRDSNDAWSNTATVSVTVN